MHGSTPNVKGQYIQIKTPVHKFPVYSAMSLQTWCRPYRQLKTGLWGDNNSHDGVGVKL